MKKTYIVGLKPTTVHGKDVEIEAESMDEAIKIAAELHCGKEQVEISYDPVALSVKPDDAEEGWECFEFDYDIYDTCADCGLTLFNCYGEGNPDNDWPWQHTNGDEGHYTNICYPCAMKRKEAGNHCPLFNRFFRDEGTSCEDCPENDCPPAKERWERNVRLLLDDAVAYYSPVVDQEEVELLIANHEFQKAFDLMLPHYNPGDRLAPGALMMAKQFLEDGYM